MKEEGINILYIEDDSNIQDIVTEFLSKFNSELKVFSKDNLDDGINFIEENLKNIDIVLLDLNLPNSSGVNTFLKLYEVTKNKLPVIIISGDPENSLKCVKLGAEDFIVKTDLSQGLLYRSIHYAIERHNNKKEILYIKRKYEELMEATRAYIFEFELNCMKILYVNDHFVQDIGYTREDLLTKPIRHFLTKKSFEILKDRFKKAKQGIKINKNIQYEFITKEGDSLWVLMTCKVHEEKKHKKKLGVGINITKQKLAEAEVQKREEEAFKYIGDKLKEWNAESIIKFEQQQDQLNLLNKQISKLKI